MKDNHKQEILLKFGQRVKQLRKEQRITQSQLAFESEISREQISRIEKGGRNVYLLTYIALSKVFRIKLKELFDFEYEMED